MQSFLLVFSVFAFLFPFFGWVLTGFLLQIAFEAQTLAGQAFVFILGQPVNWLFLKLLIFLQILDRDSRYSRRMMITQILLMIGAPLYFWSEHSVPLLNGFWLSYAMLSAVPLMLDVLDTLMPPGHIRAVIESYLNLVRFGTTYRPSVAKDQGSAQLGNILRAPEVYKDGDYIIGTAMVRIPRLEGLFGSMIRNIMNWRFARFLDAKTAPLLTGKFNGHMLVMSGAGGGKTTSFVIPNIINWSAGSLVCLDPKGEVYAVTNRHRREFHGHDVYKLKPGDPDTDVINILAHIDVYSEEFMALVMEIASWLIPKDDSKDGGAEGYFAARAQSLVSVVLATEICQWHRDKLNGFRRAVNGVDTDVTRPFPTVYALREFFYRDMETIKGELKAIYDEIIRPENANLYQFGIYNHTGNLAQEIATSFGGDEEKAWPNTISTIHAKLVFLMVPSLRKVICGELDGDGRGRLLNAKQILNGKTSVYICLSIQTMQSTPHAARMIVGPFLKVMYQAEGRKNGDTLFMIDEMQLLGKFDTLHSEAVAQGRGYGIRLCGIAQSQAGLDIKAGDKTTQIWYDNAVVQMYLAVGDIETAKKVSETIGNATVETTTISSGNSVSLGKAGGGLGTGGESTNVQVSKQKRAVLDPNEIKELGRGFAVVIFRTAQPKDEEKRLLGNLPLVVGTAFYKIRPEVAPFCDENPYDSEAGAALPVTNIIDMSFRQWKSLHADQQGYVIAEGFEDKPYDQNGLPNIENIDLDNFDGEAFIRSLASSDTDVGQYLRQIIENEQQQQSGAAGNPFLEDANMQDIMNDDETDMLFETGGFIDNPEPDINEDDMSFEEFMASAQVSSLPDYDTESVSFEDSMNMSLELADAIANEEDPLVRERYFAELNEIQSNMESVVNELDEMNLALEEEIRKRNA